MKRAFFVVYEVANAEMGLMLAREAQQHRAFDVVLWSPYHLPFTDDIHARAIERGSVYINETTVTGGLADLWTPLSGWLSAKPLRLPVPRAEHTTARNWMEALVALQSVWGDEADAKTLAVRRLADVHARRIAFCEDILVRLGVDALVFSEDNIERDSFAWIEAAGRRGISSTVITYGALSATEAETAYKGSSAHQVSEQEAAVLRQHAPHWLREGDSYRITRLPMLELLARGLNGLDVCKPWLVNCGNLDVIAIESSSALATYVAEGIDPRRLAVTGQPFHDRMHAVIDQRTPLRAELADRHGLNPDKPWLLVAMPPNQTGHRPVIGNVDYPTLVMQFCRMSADLTGWEVIVSAHPNITGADRDTLHGIATTVIPGPVADLLPLADAYLSSVSSTIKWALTLGLPVIDYDCYTYCYTDYLEEPGVRTARTHDDLIRWLEKLADPDYLSEWTTASRNRSGWWGVLDGQAMNRIIEQMFGPNAQAPQQPN